MLSYEFTCHLKKEPLIFFFPSSTLITIAPLKQLHPHFLCKDFPLMSLGATFHDELCLKTDAVIFPIIWIFFFSQIDQFVFSKGTSSNVSSFVARYFCVLRSWLEACCEMSGEGGERRWGKVCTALCTLSVLHTAWGNVAKRGSGAITQQEVS